MTKIVTVEKITPAKAEKMLNKNHDNRHLRAGVVEKYAADMKSGSWTDCTDPIAFYEDGDVADGQHRLWAVSVSGVTVEFIVVRGLSREAGLNIDVGVPRNLVDNARISGSNVDLSNRLIAVARAIATGSRGSTGTAISNADKLAYVEQYDEPARWAIANGPRGRAFSHSVVTGALGRAWFYESDKARLAMFGEVLNKGFMADEGDSAAIAIRNYLQQHAEKYGFGNRDVWYDAFCKVQNAIRYFMRRKSLKVIKAVGAECYPLPTDKKQRKAA
jgi:hypothetical protein